MGQDRFLVVLSEQRYMQRDAGQTDLDTRSLMIMVTGVQKI